MRNGTSAGISAISMPTSTFSGIDPTLISTGSLAVDRNRNAVWVSMLAFQDKRQILRYNMNTKTFKIFGMPKELTSPVGIVVDDSGNLWVTDHGTSLFYKLDPLLAILHSLLPRKHHLEFLALIIAILLVRRSIYIAVLD
jgi:virginiamycin B lyase